MSSSRPVPIFVQCVGCGARVLVEPGSAAPASCGACNSAIRSLIADAAQAVEVFTEDELERAAADERARAGRLPLSLDELTRAPGEQRYAVRIPVGGPSEVWVTPRVLSTDRATLARLQGWVGGNLTTVPVVVQHTPPTLLVLADEDADRKGGLMLNYAAARLTDRRILGPVVVVASVLTDLLGLSREQVGEVLRWCPRP